MYKGKALIEKINDFLYKPFFFSNIKKEEGVLALHLLIFFILCFALVAVFTDEDKFYIAGSLLMLIFGSILITLNIKKLDSIGFTKDKFKMTLVILIIMIALSLALNIEQIKNNEFTLYDFSFNATFYLIIVGFLEELIFRGYLWPRLVVLFGNHKGTLLCGVAFGLMHLISAYVYGNTPVNWLNTVNTIWEGVVGQYIFLFLYSFAKNIFFPSVIHASPHFFTVVRTPNEALAAFQSLFS